MKASSHSNSVKQSPRSFSIGSRIIGLKYPPFVVAEMSANHNQSLDRALQIVDAAADAGVDAIKIQTFTPDTMTLNLSKNEFSISDPASLWAGKSLYELYAEAQTPWEWHRPIFDRCRERGIIGFSTPFDESAIDFLESLDVTCYKIASFENTDLPLIRKAARTGKPLIISTGMASLKDLAETVKIARSAGCRQLVLLKCTSSYPAAEKNMNLKTISHMRTRFHIEVGLSDHTMGIGVAIASVALGAVLIEKHFTLSRLDGGIDASFSMEPGEMKLLVNETRRAWKALGRVRYGAGEDEKKSLCYRRSIYAIKDIEERERFSETNIKAIRPGLGLRPKFIDIILKKRAKKRIIKGTPIQWNLLK